MTEHSKNRPLSPHLQIYKPQITSVLSILHRFTGVGLFFGLVGLVTWVFFLAFDKHESYQGLYAAYMNLLCHPFGRFVCWGTVFCVFYHWANGIRHLAWDYGHGYDLKTVSYTGWFVVLFSMLSTLTLFLCWE
jgi:succinate dehydrogenase / fumarate reductase cytochrome b subunit